MFSLSLPRRWWRHPCRYLFLLDDIAGIFIEFPFVCLSGLSNLIFFENWKILSSLGVSLRQIFQNRLLVCRRSVLWPDRGHLVWSSKPECAVRERL